MHQDAILFTRINAAMIAETLTNYTTQDLLEDYGYELEAHHVVVLARDVQDGGFVSVSYIVTPEMFETNNPGIKLSTEHFTFVRNV